MEVVLHGRGGHAATPQLAADPVVGAAALVLRLQTVVSRQVGPAEQVTLTVGSLRAGHHPGVIPEEATLGVTIRAVSDRVLDDVRDRVVRTVRGCCEAAGSPVEPVLRVVSRTPAYRGDPEVAARLRAAHERTFGADRVAWWPSSLAAEDFPLLADGIPSGYWMLGVVGPRQWRAAPGGSAAEKLAALPGNHSPSFAPYAGLALPAGVEALASGALTALAPD